MPVTFRPFALLLACLSLIITSLSSPAAAQDSAVWLQVEAHPTLAEAQDRARAYAALFPETSGFRLRSGWYGIMLGPYPPDEVGLRLNALKRDGMIPADSFIAYARNFGERYFGAENPPASLPEPAPSNPTVAATEPEPVPVPDETRAEARDSEALLTPEDRKDLQTALQWFGFYQGGIDGAFGPGTRNSMSAWQEAQGMLEPTGILTTRQRATLLQAWRDEISSFGFTEVVETEAGITVTLPLGLVEFDHYEPPFAHFRARADGAPRIVLISQPGDQAALTGLYDILQTLDAVPLQGERSRGDRSFRIRGRSGTVDTTIVAELKGGFIKGWMLISTPGQDRRDGRIIAEIERSFATDETRALDPGMVAMDAGVQAGLLAGLAVRKPKFSRSGFFVDAIGTVATTVDAVTGCGRITIDRGTEAKVSLADQASGLALLVPNSPLAPSVVAMLQQAPERIGSEIMVAGYSYEDRLPAPVMTFGTLSDITGLNGEKTLKRLAVQALPGDAGGPVLDPAGAVIGMLLPATEGGDRVLPPDVQFALAGAEISRLLTTAGIAPVPVVPGGALPPSDLTARGTGMTVLVSCWD
jgi:hypothetical protein